MWKGSLVGKMYVDNFALPLVSGGEMDILGGNEALKYPLLTDISVYRLSTLIS